MRISMENHVLRRMKESENRVKKIQGRVVHRINAGGGVQVRQGVVLQKAEFLIW